MWSCLYACVIVNKCMHPCAMCIHEYASVWIIMYVHTPVYRHCGHLPVSIFCVHTCMHTYTSVSLPLCEDVQILCESISLCISICQHMTVLLHMPAWAVHLCLYTYMCWCTPTCLYVHLYFPVCANASTCLSVPLQVHKLVCACVALHACMCLCSSTCVHVHT